MVAGEDTSFLCIITKYPIAFNISDIMRWNEQSSDSMSIILKMIMYFEGYHSETHKKFSLSPKFSFQSPILKGTLATRIRPVEDEDPPPILGLGPWARTPSGDFGS
jgi:hypothetical protein